MRSGWRRRGRATLNSRESGKAESRCEKQAVTPRIREAFKPRPLLEIEFSTWMEARRQLSNSKSN